MHAAIHACHVEQFQTVYEGNYVHLQCILDVTVKKMALKESFVL